MDDVRKIISRLGGPTKAAKIFRIKQPSVSEWIANNRIPAARMMYLEVAYPEVLGDKKKPRKVRG